jgi:hypothetical protein
MGLRETIYNFLFEEEDNSSEISGSDKTKPTFIEHFLYKILSPCEQQKTPLLKKSDGAKCSNCGADKTNIQSLCPKCGLSPNLFPIDDVWDNDTNLPQKNPEKIPSKPGAGSCPKCFHPLVWRTAKKTGERYKGCTNYNGGCRYNTRSY